MRLGLDIGTNSIGWWLYHIADDRPDRVIDGGVRIFSDGRVPKSGASLAVDRRAARAARRDRYLRRRSALIRKLAEAGLMPSDPAERKALEGLDPYELRARRTTVAHGVRPRSLPPQPAPGLQIEPQDRPR